LAFGEEGAATAARLMERAELRAPSLLPFELASIARKKILRHPEKGAAIHAGLRLALALDVRYAEVDQVEVVDLALARSLSTYDASYLWVALRFGGGAADLRSAAQGSQRASSPAAIRSEALSTNAGRLRLPLVLARACARVHHGRGTS
jgi:predicted nucleic acid-binding protein